jgi:hypothetical protein
MIPVQKYRREPLKTKKQEDGINPNMRISRPEKYELSKVRCVREPAELFLHSLGENYRRKN